MTLPVCVLERSTSGDRWHVVDGSGTDTAQPILCHPTEVINLPGNLIERQPTCVDCYRIWRLRRAGGTAPEHMGRMELIRKVYRLREALEQCQNTNDEYVYRSAGNALAGRRWNQLRGDSPEDTTQQVCLVDSSGPSGGGASDGPCEHVSACIGGRHYFGSGATCDCGQYPATQPAEGL